MTNSVSIVKTFFKKKKKKIKTKNKHFSKLLAKNSKHKCTHPKNIPHFYIMLNILSNKNSLTNFRKVLYTTIFQPYFFFI